MESGDADWLSGAPTESELYRRALARPERRVLLTYFDKEENVDISLEELASVVADSGQVDGALDEIRLTLHHIHLPMLDEYDVLTYDAETSRVQRRATVHIDIPAPIESN